MDTVIVLGKTMSFAMGGLEQQYRLDVRKLLIGRLTAPKW
jgi:hypothetical protein